MIKLIGSVLYHASYGSIGFVFVGVFLVVFLFGGGGLMGESFKQAKLSLSFNEAGWSWLFISISLPSDQRE